MVFTLVTWFSLKGMIGKKLGFLSKTAFVLMIVTWCVDQGYVGVAQSGDKQNLWKEKKTVDFPKYTKITKENLAQYNT